MTKYEADQAKLIDLAGDFVEARKRYGCVHSLNRELIAQRVYRPYYFSDRHSILAMPGAITSLEKAYRCSMAIYVWRSFFFKRQSTKGLLELIPPMEVIARCDGTPDIIHASTAAWTRLSPGRRYSQKHSELKSSIIKMLTHRNRREKKQEHK